MKAKSKAQADPLIRTRSKTIPYGVEFVEPEEDRFWNAADVSITIEPVGGKLPRGLSMKHIEQAIYRAMCGVEVETTRGYAAIGPMNRRARRAS